MSFLHFVQEDYRIRLSSDSLSKLATFFMSNITRWTANKSAYRKALPVIEVSILL